MNGLTIILLLQERYEEPGEINLLLWLMSFIFCGLPLLIAVLILNFFMRHLRNREDHFSQWVISNEQEEAEKSKPIAHNNSDGENER